MNRRSFFAAAAPAFIPAHSLRAAASTKPNIIWIIGEDMGKQLGCYGMPQVRTPNLDRIAAEGVRFDHCFTTAPVCSASRSGFNTGVYQIATGAHNHRSHRKDGFRLPAGVDLISHRMQQAGYYTTNVRKIRDGVSGSGKTDFNFTVEHDFDGPHWNGRKPGQPVYAQINFTAPHKGPQFPRARRENKYLVDPKKLELPPYWPDHPTVRDEYANFLDAVDLLDSDVGVLWQELKKDGLLDNALVFFIGDNGRCLIRGKQWLYDAGISVPMMTWASGDAAKSLGHRAGTVRDDLCTALDMTATSIQAAGIEMPKPMHGRMLFGAGAKAPTEIFAARDRCDMTVDRIRCVRTSRYKYIRNFMPERPYTQHNTYIETSYPTLGVMKELYAAGKLNATQSLFMAPHKPDVELYDIQADPHEVNNLAGTSAHKKVQTELGTKLAKWLVDVDDKGRFPEDPKAAEL
ncbi:MAG: sulfatase [Acidobacteriota bacterium]